MLIRWWFVRELEGVVRMQDGEKFLDRKWEMDVDPSVDSMEVGARGCRAILTRSPEEKPYMKSWIHWQFSLIYRIHKHSWFEGILLWDVIFHSY
jgi:hypothetical protein